MIKFLLMFTLLTQAGAALQVNKSSLSYSAKLSEKRTEFVFKVKNNSSETLIIKKGDTSCACLSLQSVFPHEIKAGKEFEVKATFDFKGKTGKNSGKIFLYTAGGKTTLTTEVDIPVAVQIKPRFLIWRKNDRAAKVAKILIHKDWKGKISSVYSEHKDILVSLEGDELTVKPKDSLSDKRSYAVIKAKDPQGKDLEYKIYLLLY